MNQIRLRAWSLMALAVGALCVWLSMTPAWANPADRLAPMHIEADALHYDDVRLTSVFTGNVLATKGTMVLRGQQIEVRQDPAGNQFGVLHGSPTQRAFFRQQRAGLNEFIEGEAVRIYYDGSTETVTFVGQAVLRRLRGAVLSDETQGARIEYRGALGTFSVEGGAPGRTVANRDGRVRAMLSPTPEAAPAPAAPGAAVAPTLTPSPRLEPRP